MKKREARQGDYSAKKWITFSSLIVILSLICWGVWAGVEKISDSGRQITIGLQDMPTPLDMRPPWNPNAQRILLQNVYQGLLIRNDQNEVAPGLASGWNESDAHCHGYPKAHISLRIPPFSVFLIIGHSL